MAADGSLMFDTKINTDGIEIGIKELIASIKDLTTTMSNLAETMKGSFVSAGNSAAGAAKDVDAISDSAKQATAEVQSLQQQMDSITVTGLNPADNMRPDSDGDFDVYGNRVDMAIQKTEELGATTNQTMNEVTRETEQASKSPGLLQTSIQMLIQSFKDIPIMAKMGFGALQGSLAGLKGTFPALQDEIDRYTDALYYAERAGYSLGDAPYDEAYQGLYRARQNADEYRRSLEGANSSQKKVDKSANGMRKSLKKTNEAVNPLAKSVFRLGNMFKLLLIRMAMRSVISGVKEGFQNLAQYSTDTNRALSTLMSTMTRFKNAFATAFSPLVEYVAPALSNFIHLLSEALTWTSHFFSALTGKDTFVKAVKVQQDYAESLKDTGKEAKEAAKKAEKALAPFDELIQIKSKSKEEETGLLPKDMFELAEVENNVKAQADAVKAAFTGLFDPLRKSWEENGPAVLGSIKSTFQSIKGLAGDVAASFMQVWNAEGYGQAITDNLIITIDNLIGTVGNLADRFRVAWNDADTGTNILRGLGDIVLIITGFFRDASAEIKAWSRNIDFGPLLKSFQSVLSSVTPIISKVSSLLLYLLKNVLLPIASWAIEQALPAAFELISAALGVLNAVVEALQPLALWLWEEFLQPIGAWTGQIIVAAIKKITEMLEKFSDWINDNQQLVETITIVIASFFLAWKFVEFINGVTTMITLLPSLVGKLGSLLDGINPLVLAIGTIIFLVTILAKNWDAMTPTEKLISGVLAAAAAIGILAVAMGALAGGVGAAVVAASLAAGIAAASIAINAGQRKINASGYGAGGGNSSSYSSRSIPMAAYSGITSNMPRLATGTVVPPRAGEFAAILGDNNRDYEVVSPLGTMKQAFKEAIEEMGGMGGNQVVEAELILNETKFARLIAKLGNQEQRRVGMKVVTEGG